MGGHSYLNDTMWYPADPFVTEELIPYFLNRGYAVASSNGMKDLTYQEYLNLPNSGFTSPMGLPDIIESFHKTYLYIKSNYNIEDKVYLFGGS